MEEFNTALQHTFLNNTLADYLWFFGILFLGLLLKKFISKVLSRLLYRLFRRYGKHIGVEKFIALLSAPVGFLILVIIVYVACTRLSFPKEWNLDPENVFGLRFVLIQVFQGTMVLAVTWIATRVIEFIGLVMKSRAMHTESKLDDQLVPFVKEIAKVIVAGVGFLIMLAVTFDLDVLSLVAGLGIGGLAIALAAKETLENLLGSFTIFLDKPFVVGDHVKAGAVEGTIDSIGFRSTRIRALDKMLVTVPNKKMVDAELINETARTVRRAKFSLGLVYSTNESQLKSILKDIRQLLNAHSLLEPHPIVRFEQFGNSSLDILVIYVVMTPVYEEYLKVKEEINFAILEIVRKHGSNFALPTLSVFVNQPQKEDI
ncbi:MAG: mechanosensitive ion channel family protein [Bacteroidetes bacterium]|nr:mechanosensitive ion channel family protein [Bacteroidota bacterium]MBL0256715.1 mechanosensitive ion channel family protein [Bacteroidota bacterium]MBP6401894.1 mechanosensitive ion channel family protein [Bacteroidia bacterium]